jgi:hypothetical protein
MKMVRRAGARRTINVVRSERPTTDQDFDQALAFQVSPFWDGL